MIKKNVFVIFSFLLDSLCSPQYQTVSPANPPTDSIVKYLQQRFREEIFTRNLTANLFLKSEISMFALFLFSSFLRSSERRWNYYLFKIMIWRLLSLLLLKFSEVLTNQSLFNHSQKGNGFGIYLNHLKVPASLVCSLGFTIGIPLCGIARNCSRIARNCAEMRGVYRARNCVLVRSTGVGNPGALFDR